MAVWTKLRSGLAAFAFLLAASVAPKAALYAGPFAAPGDARLRSDIELLHAFGLVRGPVDSWPLPWRQVEVGLAAAESQALPPHVQAAVRRLSRDVARQRRLHRGELRGRATTDPALVRDFSAGGRSEGEVEVRGEGDIGPLTLTVGGSWNSGPSPGQRVTERGTGLSPRPTQVAVTLGNVALFAGYTDVWWGPGQDSALLFSTSARAFPKLGLKLLEPRPIGLPVLRWLGPFRFEGFVGILDEERDFANPAVIGLRAAFEPRPGLTIGLNRGMMLCGARRPCDAKIIGRALVGFFGADNTGTAAEPGNQLAGFDISYARRIGERGHTIRVHVSTVAEDETGVLLIEQFGRQAGVRLAGPLGASGALFEAGIEVQDTAAAGLLGRPRYFGSLYNHFLYTDGWTYQRRPLGSSLDGESRSVSVLGQIIDPADRRWYGSARVVDLNVIEDARSRVSKMRERIGIVTGGVDMPIGPGELRIEMRLQKNAPDTPLDDDWRVQGELGWSFRF